MSKIRVNVDYPIYDGLNLTFTAPCDCTSADGLRVYYPNGNRTFSFCDAHNRNIYGIGNVFSEGASVKVILDVTNGRAYIQNADYNTYIDGLIRKYGKVSYGTYVGTGDVTASLTFDFEPGLLVVGKNYSSREDNTHPSDHFVWLYGQSSILANVVHDQNTISGRSTDTHIRMTFTTNENTVSWIAHRIAIGSDIETETAYFNTADETYYYLAIGKNDIDTSDDEEITATVAEQARLFFEENVVQTTGDSENAVMSQKAVTDMFNGAFETEYGNNILPPDSESGYYDPSSAMTPMTSASHVRTPKPIPVVGGKRLYACSNGFGEFTTWTLCVICLDSNGAYIKYAASNAVGVVDGSFYVDLPNNCVAVHVWVGGGSSGIGISDICLSYFPLGSFEAYFEQRILSDNALPEHLKEQNILVWENVNDRVIDGLVKYNGTIGNYANYKAAYATLEPNARYRITAYCPETVLLLVFFDESGDSLDSSIAVLPSAENGGIPNGSYYDYNAVEFIMPPAAHSVALNSLSTYREPIIEKVVPVDSLREKVSDVSGKVDNALPLKGKVIVNFGDSIFGKRRPPDDISTELARLTGATVYNCGFGGCRMSRHGMTNFDAFSMYRLADAIVSGDWSLQDAGIADTTHSENVPSYFSEALAILKGLDFNNVDIITIAYGTNDFTADVDMENADNAYDTATFAGALRYSVEALLNTYPHLKIFICSQTYRFWMDSNNVFIDDSDSHTNSDGVKLTDFVAKTEDVAKAYHLPYIDNYDIGMNKYNRSQYFPSTDGTHPLTTGCHLIAAHIAHELF